jgi:hypothetical protein
MSSETVVRELAETERLKSMTGELSPAGIVVAVVLTASTLVGGMPFLGGVVGTLIAAAFCAGSPSSKRITRKS